MTKHTPSVDLTIFPRINYIDPFINRAVQRDINGRIYGTHWWPEDGDAIDNPHHYPPEDGSTCLRVTFPHDLGPDVTTIPTALFDLREDCGSPTVIDLNPLN